MLVHHWVASHYEIDQYPFIHLVKERHCARESEVSCPRTQNNGSNLDRLFQSQSAYLTMKPPHSEDLQLKEVQAVVPIVFQALMSRVS